MVENDLKHVIRRGSSSAFLNRACQWTNVSSQREGSVGKDMKEYGDAKSWIKVFFIDHLKGRVSDFVGSKKNGKFYLDSHVESLVLLNKASSASTDNSSGNEETKEHSSHVAGLDKNKKEKKKKGMKIMGGPEIVVGENRVLEGGASSSSATSRDIVTNEGNGSSKEHDLGAKNRKQKEKKKKKNGKNNMESDDEANELPGKHDFHSLILVGLESESRVCYFRFYSRWAASSVKKQIIRRMKATSLYQTLHG
uniref:Uncharacterized protein n=1 Tax=Populus alba TaxID=43335 RepID=A0A4U5MBG0_POPAL|nr:hypothetical protein D5086_0000311770 [Populus alba]